jgi:hypothetical protein
VESRSRRVRWPCASCIARAELGFPPDVRLKRSGRAVGSDAGRAVSSLFFSGLFFLLQQTTATWPKVLPSLSALTALMLTAESASERYNSAAVGQFPRFAAFCQPSTPQSGKLFRTSVGGSAMSRRLLACSEARTANRNVCMRRRDFASVRDGDQQQKARLSRVNAP